MNRQCHQKQTEQKLCNGFCAFFKSMYVNPDNRKKKEKKELVYYQNLIKESKAASWCWLGFLFAFSLCFSTPLAFQLWEGVPCSFLGTWEHGQEVEELC